MKEQENDYLVKIAETAVSIYHWKNVENTFDTVIKCWDKREFSTTFSLLVAVEESGLWVKLKEYLSNRYEKEEASKKWYELTSFFVLNR